MMEALFNWISSSQAIYVELTKKPTRTAFAVTLYPHIEHILEDVGPLALARDPAATQSRAELQTTDWEDVDSQMRLPWPSLGPPSKREHQ